MDTLQRRQVFLDSFIGFPVRFGGWAISEDSLYDIVQYCMLAKPRVILDLGTGTTTIALARYASLMLEKGVVVEIFSIDSSEEWLSDTKSLLEDSGLKNLVRLFHCPIVETKLGLYYDVEKIFSHLSESSVDLMIVDGPLGRLQSEPGEKIHTRSRYSAVPIFYKYFSNDVAVFLDDAKRVDETEIAKQWQEEFNLLGEFRNYEKGLFVFHKESSNKKKFLTANHQGEILDFKNFKSLTDQIESFQVNLNFLQSENKGLTVLCDRLKKDNIALEDENRDLYQENDNFKQECQSFQAKILNLQVDKKNREHDIHNLSKEIAYIKSSSFWRFRNRYIHCKNSIISLFKKPSLIFVILYKRFDRLRNLLQGRGYISSVSDTTQGDIKKPYLDSPNMIGDGRFVKQNKRYPSKKVDIIMVRFNNKEIEDRAIATVKKNTTHPYTLTIYDNYPKNIGLSTLWNKLIADSDCDYVCLLNTDAFVEKDWLEEMMKGFYDESVAGISPSSNNAKGQIAQRNDKKIGYFIEMETLSGFCLLIRKSAGIKFPEAVPFYGGEHAWCISARRAGYKLLWSQGTWIEHLESSSAKKQGNFETLTKLRNKQFYSWLASTTPVLFTTYNRLNFTKKTLPQLLATNCGEITIVDNNSSDGTMEYLRTINDDRITIISNTENIGVSGAMNEFFKRTKNELYVAKVDNDTLVRDGWLEILLEKIDKHRLVAIQAKHPIMSRENKSFDEWMSKLDDLGGGVYLSPFIGGSGVVFKRTLIEASMPKTGWVLGGWSEYQKQNPHLRTAFCSEVEIDLCDMKEDNVMKYEDHLEYYKETKRYNWHEIE